MVTSDTESPLTPAPERVTSIWLSSANNREQYCRASAKMKPNRDQSEISAVFYDYCVTGSNADILCPRRAVQYSRPATPSVALSPIADGQVDQVAEFLHRELNPRVTTKAWAEGIGGPVGGRRAQSWLHAYREWRCRRRKTLLFIPSVKLMARPSASAISALCVSSSHGALMPSA